MKGGRVMKKITTGLLILALSVMTTACSSEQKRNTAIGAGVGAVAGGVIGHQSGHAVEGAVIGAGVGAGAGYVLSDD